MIRTHLSPATTSAAHGAGGGGGFGAALRRGVGQLRGRLGRRPEGPSGSGQAPAAPIPGGPSRAMATAGAGGKGAHAPKPERTTDPAGPKTAALDPARLARVRLLAVDIDGCLTDGLLYWAGPDVGWTQRYAVRDGEAILRAAAAGLPVVPISRNRTACAKVRMQHLKLPLDWVGVADKLQALAEVQARYHVAADEVAYLGDGQEDAPILRAVGLAVSPPDAHPLAVAQAHYVTRAVGGRGVAEELVDLLLAR